MNREKKETIKLTSTQDNLWCEVERCATECVCLVSNNLGCRNISKEVEFKGSTKEGDKRKTQKRKSVPHSQKPKSTMTAYPS